LSTHNPAIGTTNESSLHAALKFRYTGQDGKTEVTAGEYVADGISSGGEYIEVQTGSFAPLIKKVKEFTSAGKVRIIHPVAVTKKIEVYEPGSKRKPLGELAWRRKSPVKGSPWNLFDALIYAPELPRTRRLTIEVVMVDITEKRVRDGKGAWRRKGISIFDREITAWHESVVLKKKSDYLRFVPFQKGEEFTSAMLAETAGIDPATAQRTLYVLTKLKVIERKGKQGRSWLYQIK
jgi:hypothetical protein